MPKLRPAQMRGPAKKITREVLRENPWLANLFRQRAKEIRELRSEPPTQPDLFDARGRRPKRP